MLVLNIIEYSTSVLSVNILTLRLNQRWGRRGGRGRFLKFSKQWWCESQISPVFKWLKPVWMLNGLFSSHDPNSRLKVCFQAIAWITHTIAHLNMSLSLISWLKEPINYKIVTICFDSFAIRLRSKDLKHLIPIPVNPDYRVSIYSSDDLVKLPRFLVFFYYFVLQCQIRSSCFGHLN